jgi:hypothetical protein
MPKQQVNRTRDKNDPSASSKKPMLHEDKNTKSQMEGPAAYAPLPDGQSSADESRAEATATEKELTKFDQRKRGLQDDHDPQDIGQQQDDEPKDDVQPRKGR